MNVLQALLRRTHSPARPCVNGLPGGSVKDKGAKTREQIEELTIRALAGEIAALEELVGVLQTDIFNLALQFLWSPKDAEDATQEILLKIVVNLNRFEFRTNLRTWAYRIASNYLIDARRSHAEQRNISFELIEHELRAPSPEPAETDSSRLEEQAESVKTACTHAMLLCLDRPARLAFIFGEVLQLKSNEAAEVLGTTPAAFRQRLARARKRMSDFMGRHCGLMDARNSCRCSNRIGYAQQANRPGRLPYAAYAECLRQSDALPSIPQFYQKEIDRVHRLALIYRTNRSYKSPEKLLRRIVDLVQREHPNP
ncbi:MAG: RNA polymerase sigma factor [Caldilineaceae bacterium]|nr:RNA polymerase sigma factor [Caldilineaceae bacterium]